MPFWSNNAVRDQTGSIGSCLASIIQWWHSLHDTVRESPPHPLPRSDTADHAVMEQLWESDERAWLLDGDISYHN